MKRVLYIFQSGWLRRKDNTLVLEDGEGNRRSIPVEAVSDINVFGEITLNTKLLNFLSHHHITLHFFNYYGYYTGSFYPREYYNSGLITLLQAQHYLEPQKRLYLAKAFVMGGILNMAKNLNRYDLKEEADIFVESLASLKDMEDTAQLMAYEGNMRERYYSKWNEILKSDVFTFVRRTRRPPDNPINALISFGNSLLYVSALSAIYRTHLDPRIGYLHETNRRSFTLNLDLAEVFKPIIVDRVIFRLVNRRQITEEHFSIDANMAYMTEEGMKIFIQEYESKLRDTIYYRNIGKVSYRRLLRIECYKLYKHFLGEVPYSPFVIKD
ncbi:MAG: type I-B CRISPR-associated endonuclease Cas1 [Thermotogae bacterium]|nr:type I-B CRISPR-associated endonuclease Cas1 [Thermotogota bacterium]